MLIRNYFAKLRAELKAFRARHFLGLLFILVLTVICVKVEEEFPFSHFPMYGNPNAKPVDYLFLADANGQPLSTKDYAGITAPQIKKRLNTLLKKFDESLLDKNFRPTKAAEKAGGLVLEQMRKDAAEKGDARLLTWPAGVQLKMGLIHTLDDGFNETFFTIAELPDAGPVLKGDASRAKAEVADSSQGFYASFQKLLFQYGIVVAFAAVLIVLRKAFPSRVQNLLFGGTESQRNGRLEALCFRAGLAIILWHCLQIQVDYNSLKHPAGLARFFPDAVLWFGQEGNWDRMLVWAAVLLVWYVVGWGNVIPLTALTIIHCLARSLYASQGAPHHGQNLTALVFLAQTIAAWIQVFGRGVCLAAKLKWPDWLRLGNWTTQWVLIAATIAAAYVITFVTKWDESKGRWVSNAYYFSNQIVKTHRQNYYNDLNPRYLEGVPPKALAQPDPENDRYRHPVPASASWMIQNKALARIFFSMGLLLEATAFLLILRRGWATVYGLGIISFHLMVLHLMELTFVENVLVVLVALINLPGWLIWWSNWRKADPALVEAGG